MQGFQELTEQVIVLGWKMRPRSDDPYNLDPAVQDCWRFAVVEEEDPSGSYDRVLIGRIGHRDSSGRKHGPIDQMTVSLSIRSAGPKPRPARSGCALQFVEQWSLVYVNGDPGLEIILTSPVCASKILATLSILPATKKLPSGDHARSYISLPEGDRHIRLTCQVSLSS